MSDAPTVISLFAGAGGSSAGYRAAGFRELLAVEWDHHACQCLRANFPDIQVYEGDVEKLSVDEILQRTGLHPGELTTLDTSCPCQGFSSFGRRIFDDPRNQLFREFCRILQGLQPQTFVFENVSGLVRGKMKLIFAEILRTLKAAGYRVKAKVLNTMYFGVPQSRPRLIIIGVRNDLGIEPSFPAPTSGPIAARRAIVGVKNDPAEIEMLLAAGRKYSTYKMWDAIAPGETLQDITGKNGFSCRKAFPDKPICTIVKNDGSLSMHGILHWSERRRFTHNEFARFASFPDDFIWPGEWKDIVQRIGNCVPPKFMQAIAEHIRNNILLKVEA